MADHVGWRNFWWLNVALLTFSTVAIVFMFPETKWHRVHPTEVTEIRKSLSEGSGEKGGIAAAISGLSKLSQVETAARDPSLGHGRPSKQQWKPWQPRDPRTTIWNEISTPWKLFAFPIVQLAAFIVSWSASCFLTLNLTQSQNFAAPPYLYSSETIGFFNFAILIGAFIGLGTAGPLSDWISMKLTIRNRGIREPEMRLLTMVPYTLIMILGNVIVAVGYQRSWSWKVMHHSHPSFSHFVPLFTLARVISPPLYANMRFPAGHCDNRLHLRRDPSRRPTRDRLDLRRRLVQARRGRHLRRHHHQQERVGLWLQQVHHPLDHRVWVYPSHHDQHDPHHRLVSVWHPLLVQGQDLPQMVEEQQGPPDVKRQDRCAISSMYMRLWEGKREGRSRYIVLWQAPVF